MNAFFVVEKCPDPVILPGPDVRNVKQKNDKDYDSYEDEDLFNTITFDLKKTQLQARASRGGNIKIWKHYIAIEEIVWDYAPHLKSTDRLG